MDSEWFLRVVVADAGLQALDAKYYNLLDEVVVLEPFYVEVETIELLDYAVPGVDVGQENSSLLV